MQSKKKIIIYMLKTVEILPTTSKLVRLRWPQEPNAPGYIWGSSSIACHMSYRLIKQNRMENFSLIRCGWWLTPGRRGAVCLLLKLAKSWKFGFSPWEWSDTANIQTEACSKKLIIKNMQTKSKKKFVTSRLLYQVRVDRATSERGQWLRFSSPLHYILM